MYKYSLKLDHIRSIPDLQGMEYEPDFEKIGNALRKAVYGNVYIEIVVSGIQLFMSLYILSTYLETPKSSRKGKLPYVVASLAIFTLQALVAALDASLFQELLYKAQSGEHFVDLYLANFKTWTPMTTMLLTVVYSAVADGLLMVRCYIVWSDNRWVCAVPFILYPLSIAFGIYSSVLPTDTDPNKQNLFSSIYIFVAVAVNVSFTALIAIRLIQSNRHFRRILPSSSFSNVYNTIATMLIEAAVPPAVLGVVLAITGLVPSDNDINSDGERIATIVVNTIFQVLYYSWVALSSQMIIFRVSTGRIWHPSTLGAKSVRTNTGAPNALVFAKSETSQCLSAPGGGGSDRFSSNEAIEEKREAGVQPV